MNKSLKTTFSVLTSTSNVNAIAVMNTALDSQDDQSRQFAIEGLILRGSSRGQIELIRRLDSLSAEERAMLREHSRRLQHALKQGLINGDPNLQKQSLEAIRIVEQFDLMPTLHKLANDKDFTLADECGEVLSELVNRLYEHTHPDTDHSTAAHVRGAPELRLNILTEMDVACSDFEHLRMPEKTVEFVLALGDPDNFAVKKVLVHGSTECRKLAVELFETSTHPGVMQLVIDSMNQNYPLPRAIETLQNRRDPEFICHLLRAFPSRLSSMQQKNFRQIESVSWLNPDDLLSGVVPAGLQPNLLTFLSATGLSNDDKVRIQEWIVRHGSPEGRLAAADVLAKMDESTVQDIVFDGLASGDADIQAWATGQLREQHLPAAFSLLIDRLDSPLDEVRDAARESLKDFNLEKMLSLYDHLDAKTCEKAGALMLKIEPNCAEKLIEELNGPIRRRRINAARAAQSMGIQKIVAGAIRSMLNDEETLVRRTAAEILATVPAPETLEALEHLKDDESARVREEAERSIEAIKQQVAEAASI